MSITKNQIRALFDVQQPLSERVEKAFEAGGVLQQHIPGFRVREGQLAFAKTVAKAIQTRETVIAEAGTGTGKTFAYLMPAILSGARTIVSTAGKSLQDQIMTKDVPLLRKVLQMPIDACLLKGRSNYICHYYLEVAQSEDRLPERDSYMKLRRIAEYAATSETGDRAGVAGVPEDDRLWPMVTSTRENCLGKERCPRYEDCFVKKARDKALESQVVIVNHHLYLSSMAIKRDAPSIDAMLPAADLTVVDEAHQLSSIATAFFGESFATRDIDDMAFKAKALGARESLKGSEGWNVLYDNVRRAIGELRLRAEQIGLKEGDRYNIKDIADFGLLSPALARLIEACQALRQAFKVNADRDDELDTLAESFAPVFIQLMCWQEILKKYRDTVSDDPAAQAERDREITAFLAARREQPVQSLFDEEALLEDALETVAAPAGEPAPAAPAPETEPAEQPAGTAPVTDSRRVLWIEVTQRGLRFNNTPLTFASEFQTMRSNEGGAWVFTSATLSSAGKFDHFCHELGIEQALANTWESPFNYWEQGCFYLPRLAAPANNTAVHTHNVVEEVWPLINAAGGRTFLLCTSLAAVEEAGRLLQAKLEANGNPYPLFVQGERSKLSLIEAFRKAGNGILVGSMGFWEGVDVKGDALSLVVIDKIPFAPPNDPVISARQEDIRERGGQPFNEYVLPEAVISLKQGSGRLIRSEHDRGMLVICDSRIASRNYGRVIQQSLPDFYCTRSKEKALSFFLTPEVFARGLYS